MMRRLKPGNDDDPGTFAERVAESRDLDLALRAMGSRYSHGYEIRLAALDGAICVFVDGLRGEDVGPAQVLISLKEHLAASAAFSRDVDAFAVRRCIARYYES